MGLDIFEAEARVPQQKNLRTCGRYVGDNPAVPPRVLHRTQSTPAIPSRLETTLFKGPREFLGFGSHSMRFNAASGPSEGPGPGSYGQPKSFHEEFSERDSWGKRGTGAFASRCARVGPRAVPVQPRAGRGVPGPGKYDELDALAKIKESKDFNKVPATASFAAPVEKKLGESVPPSALVPGPGHYSQAKTKADEKEANAARAAFRSKSSRMGDNSVEAGNFPGPGEYYDGAVTNFPPPDSQASGAARMQEAYNAVFKTPSRPRLVSVHRDLPTADYAAREVLGDFADEIGHAVTAKAGVRMPGPGAHDIDRDVGFQGSTIGTKGNSAFLEGAKRTEWAGRECAEKPGPGRYNPRRDFVVEDRLTSAVSAFDSMTERGMTLHKDAPGPCYYSPKLPKPTKSFRAKSDDTWAPVHN